VAHRTREHELADGGGLQSLPEVRGTENVHVVLDDDGLTVARRDRGLDVDLGRIRREDGDAGPAAVRRTWNTGMPVVRAWAMAATVLATAASRPDIGSVPVGMPVSPSGAADIIGGTSDTPSGSAPALLRLAAAPVLARRHTDDARKHLAESARIRVTHFPCLDLFFVIGHIKQV
jgi:hypothetical protein